MPELATQTRHIGVVAEFPGHQSEVPFTVGPFLRLDRDMSTTRKKRKRNMEYSMLLSAKKTAKVSATL